MITKIHFRGRRTKVRILSDEDIITEETYCKIGHFPWKKARAIGDKVKDHPYWQFMQLVD